MKEYLKNELRRLKGNTLIKDNLTDDQLFNILTLQYLCFKEQDFQKINYELMNCITDGANDGGIDYVFFDYEDNKVIIGQNKYSENVTVESFTTEISKILGTIRNFEKGQTGSYNQKVKEKLQIALDNLTDETEGNIDIYFSSKNSINKEKALKKVEDLENKINQIHFFDADDLEEIIEKIQSSFEVVPEARVDIDKANNLLQYFTDDQEGIFINISSKSLVNMYNKYNSKGLFNLNIRRFIRSKTVDDGIIRTLNSDRDNFWFLNNGLTIACKDYYLDGDSVDLYDFSIVNGGQTTTLIGTYKGNNEQEFYIPCKIIKSKEKLSDDDSMRFFNKIAEATNSQKPIQPKDLKSNSPEMVSLKKLLGDYEIGLEIKRGEKNNKSYLKIKNDEFAQLMFSFVNQKPGTARSNKKAIFTNNKFYNSIFKQNYKNDSNKLDFIVDLIRLNFRYVELGKKYKEDMTAHFNNEEANIYNNGKTTIFALFGVAYRLVNEDVILEELNSETRIVEDRDMVYGKFISNYKEDDIDKKLDGLIQYFVEILDDEYQKQYDNKKVSSVSNFFKTDSKYINDILNNLRSKLKREKYFNELLEYGEILKR